MNPLHQLMIDESTENEYGSPSIQRHVPDISMDIILLNSSSTETNEVL